MEESLKIQKRKGGSDVVKALNKLNVKWIRTVGGISLNRRRRTTSTKLESKKSIDSLNFWGRVRKNIREVFISWVFLTCKVVGERIYYGRKKRGSMESNLTE